MDKTTLTIVRNELVEVANLIADQRLPLDELIDKSLEKIDHCIDELKPFCEE